MDAANFVNYSHTDNWRKFAKVMFKLEDADPGYVLLKRAQLKHDQKLRYVLAWCTFYNPGIAAIASEYKGSEFYDYLISVYSTAKRASERRHFRGVAGLKALAQWRDRYPKPEAMVEACYAPTYMGVRTNMKPMAQMGDYFYWKLADVWDTVFDMPVDFTNCERYMPKVPQQGAELIMDREGWIRVDSRNWLPLCMNLITKHVQGIDYPVKGGRRLALQEAETVCCVFKQHVVGDYRYGFRTVKAVRRFQAAQNEAPATVKALLGGVWAGGVWTPEQVARVGEVLDNPAAK